MARVYELERRTDADTYIIVTDDKNKVMWGEVIIANRDRYLYDVQLMCALRPLTRDRAPVAHPSMTRRAYVSIDIPRNWEQGARLISPGREVREVADCGDHSLNYSRLLPEAWTLKVKRTETVNEAECGEIIQRLDTLREAYRENRYRINSSYRQKIDDLKRKQELVQRKIDALERKQDSDLAALNCPSLDDILGTRR